MSPDTASSLFPERPIRPLPKRKLREKLSPRAIQTIEYPLSAVDGTPLFYYPTYAAGGRGPRDLAETTREHHNHDTGTCNTLTLANLAGHDTFCEGPSAEGQWAEPLKDSTRHATRLDGEASVRQTPSAASSIDGYDSFENTNNKKKRKIPSASDSTLRDSHFVSSESVGGMQPGSVIDGRSKGNASSYTGLASLPIHNEGISGSGRGRLGRAGHARSPLKTLSDGNNAWSGRPLKTVLHHSGTVYETSGIISNAIANAERLPSPGQENISSLLKQHSTSGKTTPMASQFTFTCGSEVPGTVSWPDTSLRTSTVAERTSAVPLNRSAGVAPDAATQGKATAEGRKRSQANSHRQLDKDLVLAARDRRQAAAAMHHRNAPRPEDIWICEFCEYESIFGTPPKALIREYEIKDRRLRQEEADRRRLLEKAKAKSRKGKKGNKAVKGSQSSAHSLGPVSEEQDVVNKAPPMEPNHSHSTQSEGGFEDLVDDYRPRDPPDILGLYEQRRRKVDTLSTKA